MGDKPHSPRIRFGVFEVDLEAGELRKSGVKIKLQEQPFQVLAALLERPGAVVTREQLCQRLWPDGTFVDFDTSLAVAVNKIRQALGDSADNPHFVETLPRRGYRFIYPLEGKEAIQGSSAEPPTPPPPSRIPWILAGLAGLAVLSAILFVSRGWREAPPEESPTPRIHFVAVLPLKNLSGDPEQEYFSDGMTDALISDLGTIAALRVISRTSAMQYKHSTKPLREIARELNVSHIVEGSVLRAGDQVRITTQLIDAANDHQLWSQSYERPLKDVLALQSEVAQEIAREIQVTLEPQERTRLAGRRPVNPEAQDAYFKGLFAARRPTRRGVREQIEYFQKAVELDPDYALAYARLAGAYMVGAHGLDETPPKEALANAKAAALRAMQLDDTLDVAHGTNATFSLHSWDWSSAKAGLQRALALNPSSSGAHLSYGYYLMFVERDFDGAFAEAERAVEVDPRQLAPHDQLARIHHYARRYDQAIEQYQKVLELDPNYRPARNHLGKAYAENGMYEDAVAVLKKSLLMSPVELRPKAYLAYAYALSGERAEALRILNELSDLSKTRYVASSLRALIHTSLGDKEQALELLEKAHEEHDVQLLAIRVDPAWDPLRSDTRFKDILKRMNLAD